MLRKILVKDFTNRIDWKELFEFTITETGEVFAPGVSPSTNQFGLRASLRNSSGFGLNFTNNSQGTYSNGINLSESVKGNSTLLSPKPLKEGDDARSYLMKKKSPYKTDDANSSHSQNANSSYTTYKNEAFSKNDRSNRFDLLLKNHAKCSTLNQMILDLFRIDQPKSLYVAFYLFKSIEK
mgnify:CR=1 FL=1